MHAEFRSVDLKELSLVFLDGLGTRSPDQLTLSKDVSLMGGAAIAKHPKVNGTTGGALERIHESRFVRKGNSVICKIQKRNVQVAV
jgi:hypothetical protein